MASRRRHWHWLALCGWRGVVDKRIAVWSPVLGRRNSGWRRIGTSAFRAGCELHSGAKGGQRRSYGGFAVRVRTYGYVAAKYSILVTTAAEVSGLHACRGVDARSRYRSERFHLFASRSGTP